ncbi:unnamed protein product [Aspergillus oryzae]|uniref:Unnamed protein product n=1 Tax=Aspergillus oryzae var. brunneus TaxID=332754 RepID=A0ABQ6KBB2_ASPOZ|nr:unnamed protein product [Aspergillus oryzae]GMF93052.1 unnamed protein product [Aspergillus oryzae]GMG09836.1 unnamed protein product [Aspergillus oryzae]GMG41151.1 unnamed protein product [Aspergillus oryzae var. brunneus]
MILCTVSPQDLIANPILLGCRYVEMLEQQQAWLVYGLQELYRRTSEGEGWPGEPLKCEANGHPLTHDLLTRLGALDQSKGERFEESTESMQQELWKQNAGHMQRQDSSDGSSESAQSPVLPTRFSDAFARQPLTPPTFSPPLRQGPTIKTEPQIVPNTPSFIPPMAMHGDVVNPLALQDPQQWPNSLGNFDDMDLMATADYNNLSFDDPVSSPMFNRQIPMNCMSYMDAKNDYEDISQFLNANPPEITSS